MENELRKSGIDVIGDVPWGTHFCQFYQTKQDLVDTLVPYFIAGLRNNEFCMWVTADNLTASEAFEAISAAMPDFRKYLTSGQIDILSYNEWYLKSGSFNSQEVLDGWVDKLNKALAKGFSGLRLTGNTFWLEKEQWNSFTDYEEAVNNVIGKYHMIALCTYCLDKCNASEIIDVILNHEFALIKQEGKWELVENSRYKITKSALAGSEKRYEQLYSSMNEGLAQHDIVYDESGKAIDYVITHVNPAFEKNTGITAIDAVGKRASHLYGTSKPPYLDIYAKVAATGEPVVFETFFAPMGKYFNVSAFSPEKGKFATVFSDITNRKKIEEQLQQSQRDLTRAQAVANTGNWRLDLLHDELMWSDETYRIFGVKPGTPMNYEKFLEIIYPQDKEYVDEKWNAALRGESYDIEHRILVDGKTKWVREKADLEFDADKKLIGGFGTVQDITERKEAEESVLKEKAFTETSINSLPGVFYLFKENDKFLRWNRNFELVTGYTAEEFSELSPLDLFTSEEKNRVADAIRRVFTDGRASIEASLVSKSGKKTLYYFTGYRMQDEGVLYLIGSGIDISERARVEEEVKQLNEELTRRAHELEASNREMEVFAYSVSHDLRAPLRSMQGFSEVLLEDFSGVLNDEGKDYLKRIKSSAELMAELIDDMLQLSRLTRVEMLYDNVDLSGIAQTILAELQRRDMRRKAVIKVAQGLTSRGDARLLGVALENLLENAWKFTEKVPEAHIEFGSMEKDSKTTYFVQDNGAGFDMTYADKLFQPFQRLHSASEFPGNGIGLASVHRIIQRHGGKVWAEGNPGKGATFYFTLN
jgi:PAS domain S-box-containing protein